MYEYHKIDTVFYRSEEGARKLLPGLWRDLTVRYLSDLNWV